MRSAIRARQVSTSPVDGDDVFAFRGYRAVDHFGEQLAQAGTPALLVQLRQFAAQEGRAVRAEHRGHVGKGRVYAVHGLEEYQRTIVTRTGLQPFFSGNGPSRIGSGGRT